MSDNRALLLIAGGIAGLVLLAVAVVLLAGGREPQTFEPDSPQAAIQGYLLAWNDRDYAGAYGHFSSAVQEDLTLDEYRRAVGDYYGYANDGVRRSVYIDRVDTNAERARVQLTVEEFYGEGMGASSYRSARTLRMVREQGAWKIDDPLIWLDPGPFGDPYAY